MNEKLTAKYFFSQWLIGIVTCIIFLLILVKLRMGKIGALDFFFVFVITIASLIIYVHSNIYLTKSRFDLIYKLFLNWTMVLASCVSVLFFLKISDYFSRLVLFQIYVFGYVFQIISYFLVKTYFRLTSTASDGAEYSLVVGKENFTKNFSETLWVRRSEHLIGYLDENTNRVYLSHPVLKTKVEHQGGPVSAEILEDLNIGKIYLSHTQGSLKKVLEGYRRYSAYPVDVVWHLAIDEEGIDSALTLLDGFPFIQLCVSRKKPNPLFYLFKRAIDLFISSALIIFLSPLLLFIAVLVRFSSKGPIFFKQKRHGLHGKEIMVYKFRSMYVHKFESLMQATRLDPRITPIGRFIRKTSIDELPQLWNVLLGSMSLVGPRPHPVEFNEYYGSSINEYMMRHRIKPGITGLAQVYGARGETDTMEKMLRRIKFDLKYIQQQSLLMDLKILFLTPFALIFYLGH